MPQEQSHTATAAVAGLATIVVALAALAGAYWIVYPQIAHTIDARFSALDAKVADVAKTNNQDAIAKLSGNVAAINETLQAMKTAAPAKTADDRTNQTLARNLDTVNQSIDGLKAQLASLKATVDAIGANAAKTGSADDMKTIGETIGKRIADSKQAVDTAVASVRDAMTGLTGKIAAVQSEISAVKADVAGIHTEMAGIKTAVADAQPTGTAKVVAAAPAGRDLAIVSVTRDVDVPTPSIPSMNVYFDRVGSADDKGQTAAIVKRLQALLKERNGCTVTVTGHTDTLGPDDYNLDLSKQRADDVAAKLKAALAGQNVVINESARGERALETWTPDNTPRRANRRVQIDVACKS